jgi:hypothetical protein
LLRETNHEEFIDFQFLSLYRNHHHPHHAIKQVDEIFFQAEKMFLNIFQIGLFEVYEFLYNLCEDDHHFKNWIISLKGEEFYEKKAFEFNHWYKSNQQFDSTTVDDFLTADQLNFWEENGYLKIDQMIDHERCDAVIALIDNKLQIDIKNKDTWYPNDHKMQGLMLQLYQGEALENIRNDKNIKAVFASLYQTNNILPNCEKVSFNPPENSHFSFKGSPLHWDIDFNVGPTQHIQGLLYLNDVPVNRGPFTLIPGYHHQIAATLENYQSPELALVELRKSDKIISIPGKKGDLIVWLESLPHAASPNYSDQPRYVQYISFYKS